MWAPKVKLQTNMILRPVPRTWDCRLPDCRLPGCIQIRCPKYAFIFGIHMQFANCALKLCIAMMQTKYVFKLCIRFVYSNPVFKSCIQVCMGCTARVQWVLPYSMFCHTQRTNTVANLIANPYSKLSCTLQSALAMAAFRVVHPSVNMNIVFCISAERQKTTSNW